MAEDTKRGCNCEEERQFHVHEFLGSVVIFEEEGEEPHNHRFAGVSGEAMYEDDTHIHVLKTRTDFFEDHFHEICVRTGPAICVDDIRHVHFVSDETEEADEHVHNFIVATLIENPIGEPQP